MSAIDWVHQTREQFQKKPPRKALAFSTRRFVDGLLNRLLLFVSRVVHREYLYTTIAGERVRFVCRTVADVRRTRSLASEKRVADWLLKDTDGDTVVWDVGAFHGHYSVVAAAKGAKVFAFEPIPESRERILENKELNGMREPEWLPLWIEPVALSSRPGLFTMSSDGPRSTIGERGHSARTIRGDDWEPIPTVVKVDTEGHEVEVLRGMKETLEAVERIVVEVHSVGDVLEVEYLLEQAGLSVSTIPSHRPQTFVTGVR